jgi:hypothetical protein
MAFDPKRSATSGRFVLDIDGQRAAFLKKFDGLHYEGDVAQHDHGPLNMQTKNIANYKYGPGKATIGLAMGKAMYTWIRQSFHRDYATKDGAFIAADFNYKETHRVDFYGALITSVGVPKLDGSSKEAGYLEVEFEAENVLHRKGTGTPISGDYGVKEKAWLPSCFSFELAGLEDACKRVATIDAFTWKQSVVADQIGAQRVYTKHPAKVTVPDLKLSISAADSEPWRAWAEDWFVRGKHLAPDHKDGAIRFLGPDMKQEIGRIELKTCGLKKFADEPHEANSEKIKRIAVELYVEEMEFFMDFVDK